MLNTTPFRSVKVDMAELLFPSEEFVTKTVVGEDRYPDHIDSVEHRGISGANLLGEIFMAKSSAQKSLTIRSCFFQLFYRWLFQLSL